jgi:dihydroflavonol-4-reductase
MRRQILHPMRRGRRCELGYAARPYREGLSDAIDWFRGAGYLK